jgi:hypothetical protein
LFLFVHQDWSLLIALGDKQPMMGTEADGYLLKKADGRKESEADGRSPLFAKNKTAFSDLHHSLFVIHWLVKLFERDGLEKKAGDEIRTRDSLLGRQVVSKNTACFLSISLRG